MKRVLIAAGRGLVAACVLLAGLSLALPYIPSEDASGSVAVAVVAFLLIVTVTGWLGGWVARAYLLWPALAVYWLLWSFYIDLAQWHAIKTAQGTYMDGVLRYLPLIAVSSALLGGAILVGYRGIRLARRTADPRE